MARAPFKFTRAGSNLEILIPYQDGDKVEMRVRRGGVVVYLETFEERCDPPSAATPKPRLLPPGGS